MFGRRADFALKGGTAGMQRGRRDAAGSTKYPR